jgi:hypothetical protein
MEMGRRSISSFSADNLLWKTLWTRRLRLDDDDDDDND